ncbi:hypothetical protein ON010_g15594 [Phytophthora cinnamomi]|nr:hypothetical protein ON010_g15594 [Phytophthora cinnamomi]
MCSSGPRVRQDNLPSKFHRESAPRSRTQISPGRKGGGRFDPSSQGVLHSVGCDEIDQSLHLVLSAEMDFFFPVLGWTLRTVGDSIITLAAGDSPDQKGRGWLGRNHGFDGAAKLSDRCGIAGCILWKLPSWDVIEVRGFHFEDSTVNEAEYHGLIEGSKIALERGIPELVIVGDSRIAIEQAQGLIQNRARSQRHVNSDAEIAVRDYNGDTDVSGTPDVDTTTYAPEAGTPAAAITERWRRILMQQQAEPWTRKLRDFLSGNLESLSSAETEDVAKIASQFILDARGALYYLSRSTMASRFPAQLWCSIVRVQ